MDAEISKATQKILAKQGMKFKLNTKVMSGDSSGEGVKLEVEAAKGGKAETVSSHVNAIAPTQERIIYPSTKNELTLLSSTPMSASSPLAAVPTPQVSG